MGVFFYTHSVALIEDIGLETEYESETSLITDMNAGYEQVCNYFELQIDFIYNYEFIMWKIKGFYVKSSGVTTGGFKVL